MEFLTCPSCENRVKTAKLLQFADEKRVKCERCNHEYTLGEARELGKKPVFDVLAVLEEAPKTAQNRSISSQNAAIPSENGSISVPLTQFELNSPIETTEFRRCPHCRSQVPLNAKKCLHCHEWIDDNPRTGRLIAAFLSIIFPGLGQLSQGRIPAAIIGFSITTACYCAGIPFGLICHAAIVIEAAIYTPK